MGETNHHSESNTSAAFNDILVATLEETGQTKPKYTFTVTLIAEYDPEGFTVRLCNGNQNLQEFLVQCHTEWARVGRKSLIFYLGIETLFLTFPSPESNHKFHSMLASVRSGSAVSIFKARTEDSSATQYFQFYGYLSQQQNMMQDFVRTSTYQKAILSNLTDFRDKIILDVGAGSGILSFFAQQAGAAKVYAVEGSSIAKHAEMLVRSNKLDDVIQVISGKIEEIELPEQVDMIISEPMGYMLLNERMLETYLHAKKWLKPGGKMFPSRGDLHVAPFQDEALYMEQINKVNFWYQDYFHGVNLSSLRDAAMKEYFRQPIVDTFDIRICLSKTQRHIIDFVQADETDLHKIDIPYEFHILQTGTVHGLAFWFDVAFAGSAATVWLSTAPTEPLTHWYQVRCLLQQPILAEEGQVLTGRVVMTANMKQSYDVSIECRIEGTSTESQNTLDLKNPYFRYTGVQPQPPPGENSQSPSEVYWTQVDLAGARQAVNLVNGMIVDGLGHVSLDSAPTVAAVNNIQPNIHQGSILSTGRVKEHQSQQRSTSNGGSSPATPMSAANSLQFNQLIGGAVTPSVFSQPQTSVLSVTQQHQAIGLAGVSPSLMIGDYVQGNLGGVIGTGFK